jgi:hypothetical protein
MEVNPKLLRVCNVIKQASAGTVYTTPTNKSFYLTYAQLSGGATGADNFDAQLNVTMPEQAAAVLMMIRAVGLLAATANANSAAVFNPPILLKRGSIINITNADTAFTKTSCSIAGYTVED